jgi:cell division protein FtsI (penicillin-binding protein 3)
VKDVTGTAEKLASLLKGDAGVLEARLAGDRGFVWLDRHVSTDIAKAVRDAKIPGIYVAREPRRWYPGKSVAGTVIGRADIDGNGLDGIELSMNDLLSGKHGKVTALRDARGHRMLADGVEHAEAAPGAAVRLTLDRSIQAIADEALANAIATHKAKNGVVVVLDVSNSHVLAMAAYPTYDPNTGGDHGARNRPVTDVYEAGSVMKVFTIAAALEEGIVKPETGFSIGPTFKVGPKLIRDTHPEPYLNVSDIIKTSSNIGAAKIGMRLGREKLHAYLKKFGFGTKTEIELPGEQQGKIRDGGTWRDIELATISFGYGLTITPLQLAAGLAAIGNNGVYRAPRIVDEVVDGDGTLLYRSNSEPHQMVSEKTAAQMRDMLMHVFDKKTFEGSLSGTASSIDVQGFKCGGKTGTAHKYDHTIRAYSPNRYLSSFAGIAPIDHPRLAIVVMIDEPGGNDHYGGKVAGPVFAQVASASLRYLGVPGDPIPPPKVPGQPAAKPAKPAPAPVVVAVAEADAPEPLAPDVPDFRGMGVSRALDEARKLHLDVEMTGTGQVVDQEVIAGGKIKLRFSDDARRISAP